VLTKRVNGVVPYEYLHLNGGLVKVETSGVLPSLNFLTGGDGKAAGCSEKKLGMERAGTKRTSPVDGGT
jgi:hypothetical protein